MSLEQYLEELTLPDSPVKHTGLLNLSSLSREEMAVFRDTWDSFELDRKLLVLFTLVELAEDSTEVNFASIFSHCLKDEAEDIRIKAVAGLWEYDDRSLIAPLITLLVSDPSQNVRASSATALGKFASLAMDDKLLERDGDRIREALQSIINNPREVLEVRRRAIEAIAAFDGPDTQAIITEAYESSDSDLKQSAIYAMGRNGDNEWLPIVFHELTSKDPAIRYEAVNACAALGDEEAVPVLVPLLEDAESQVQQATVEAIGTIGGSLAKRILAKCVRSGDDTLEEAARTALIQINLTEDPFSFSEE